MGRSRLLLFALLGSLGCTQGGAAPEGPPPPERLSPKDARAPDVQVRAQGENSPAPSPEAPPSAPDYAARRREQYQRTYFMEQEHPSHCVHIIRGELGKPPIVESNCIKKD